MLVLGSIDDETGPILGYGTWLRKKIKFDGENTWAVHVPWFGIDGRYQGLRDDDGDLCADTIFATLVRHASSDTHVHAGMLLQLVCHVDNDRGLRFWKRHGFEEIGTSISPSGTYRELARDMPD